ncbi:MAG: YdiY family protein [Bdellovibrionia bacterium]
MQKIISLITLATLFFGFNANAQFKGEAEAGAVVISGNSKSESYSLKTKNTYKADANSYTIDGRYVQTTSEGVESARNWDAGIRYDRALVEDLSFFLGQKAESDVYAGFVQRDSTDLGGKYFLFNDEAYKWFFELGYRYTRTHFVGSKIDNSNFGRLYTEFNRILSKELTFKYWAEYLPNFTNSDAYLANTEASLNVMLSQTFSLKISYLLKYQNIGPVGGERTDTTYTTSLVANF